MKKYKYSIKTLFTVTSVLSLFLAIFLRSIRYMIESIGIIDFDLIARGFLYTFYWAFWLCYNESFINNDINTILTNGFSIGLICGVIFQVISILYILLILMKRSVFKEWSFNPFP